jgi:hypothetical protein
MVLKFVTVSNFILLVRFLCNVRRFLFPRQWMLLGPCANVKCINFVCILKVIIASLPVF